MNSEATFRIIDSEISRSNVIAQVGALLYSTGLINDNEEIVEMYIGNMDSGSQSPILPIKIKVKEVKDVSVH